MTSTRRQPRTTKAEARLSCRLDARIKRRAEEAAALLGQSMTDFAEAALAERAEATFERHARIELSERDFARFVDAIENPAPPTPQLIAAMDRYEQMRAEQPDAGW